MKRGKISSLGVAVAGLLVASLVTAEPASALDQNELRCRRVLMKSTRRMLGGSMKARQRCNKSLMNGSIGGPVDCVGGNGDAATEERLRKIEARVDRSVLRKCSYMSLLPLGFPGTCADSNGGVFDNQDLSACMRLSVKQSIVGLLTAEYPDSLPDPVTQRVCDGGGQSSDVGEACGGDEDCDGLCVVPVDPGHLCVDAVGRHGARMVSRELRARQSCMFQRERGEAQGSSKWKCRHNIVPYGDGTRNKQADASVLAAYLRLLLGIPTSCQRQPPCPDCSPPRLDLDVDALGYDSVGGCQNYSGGDFDAWDLRHCVFDSHRKVNAKLLNIAFPVEPECGDSIKEGNEQCDDGGANSDTTPDACRSDCTLAACGDDVTDSGETCDNGQANSDTTPDACRDDCRLARCGDGVVDSGEECDGSPGCLGDCTLPPTYEIAFLLEADVNLASLQFVLDYSGVSGDFGGSGGAVDCLAPGWSMGIFNNMEDDRLLKFAGISILGFAGGGTTIATCQFSAVQAPLPEDFVLTLDEATDLDGATVTIADISLCAAGDCIGFALPASTVAVVAVATTTSTTSTTLGASTTYDVTFTVNSAGAASIFAEQLSIAYTGGAFSGEAIAVECTLPSGWTLSAFNHDSVAGTLSWGGFSLAPLAVPFDIGPCTFNATSTVDSSNFTVAIDDDGAGGTSGVVSVTVVEQAAASLSLVREDSNGDEGRQEQRARLEARACRSVEGEVNVPMSLGRILLKGALSLGDCPMLVCDRDQGGDLTSSDAHSVLLETLGRADGTECY